MAPLAAQAAPLQEHWEQVQVRSGIHANPSPVEGVVWSHLLTISEPVPWIRVWFKDVVLEGDSYLRVAALADGEVQTLRMKHVLQWDFTTAYFNGNAVLIELVAAPGTHKNLVEIDRVMVGDLIADVPPPETICGSQDNRVPSNDPRAGRIVGIGCSGWIISQPTTGNDRLHLSAGHCFATNQVLQFNVPASSTSCSLGQPPVASQFAVDYSRSLSTNGGIGNDWWVFGCFPNTNTGLTTWQTMNAAFTLATSIPSTGTTLVNFGYGLDGTPTNGAPNAGSCGCSSPNGARNQTQQTHTGPLTALIGTRLEHQVDTCGGNSGSVIAVNSSQLAVAIHTNAGCGSTSGSNSATAVTNTGLQAAISTLANGGGPTAPANDNCTGAIALATGSGVNGPFSSLFATPGSSFTCVGPGTNDVWFTYTASASGVHTFDTCSATRTFDTTLEVFSGGCAALTSIACNDDSCGLGSSVSPTLTAGQTYRIHVGGYNGATGDFDLTVSAPNVLGDDCATAIPVVLGLNGPFDNGAASASAPAWPCAFGTRLDLWFEFTANCTAPTTFYTCTATRTVDTVLEVFSGGCGALTSLGCNDDMGGGCGLASSLTVPLTAGQTYLARIGGYNGAIGSFDLVVECGTGTGSFTPGVSGCGPTSFSVTGQPHIAGTVTATLTGNTGLPFIGYGFNLTPVPFCGCTFGHEWAASFFATSVSLTIPCDPAFIGVPFGLQGADFGGVGGCPSPQLGLSNSVTVTIG
ncbi:MAG: hypothetical protein AB7O97_17560 [Planctomycetota bacterium]